MTPPTDITLLLRWQHHRDAHAFKALTQRYGGMVFGVCNRVLHNAADAEEIAQECFLKLAQHPDAPQRAVGPWLHSVALHTSINRIRSDRRRRDREQAYEAERPSAVEFSARDLIEQVDEVIHALPADLRAWLVGHFLAARPQQEIAQELGVSSRTVRRKTDEAIAQVRKALASRGVTMSAGALSIALTGLGAEALSPTLAMALGKVAVGGGPIFSTANWAAAGNVTKMGAMITMKNVIWAAMGVGLLSMGLWWGMAQQALSPDAPERVAADLSHESTSSPEAERVDDVSIPEVAPEPEAGALNSDASALVSVSGIAPIANPTRYGTLAGRVVDDGGQPIAGASVMLAVAGLAESALDSLAVPGFPEGGDITDENLALARRDRALELALAMPGHQYRATSDRDGAFLISDIRFAGVGFVLAEAPDLAMNPKKTAIVENERADVQLALRPAKTVRGVVLDTDGKPIADATVASVAQVTVARGPKGETIVGGGGGGRPVMTPFRVRTDSTGQFHLALADADYAAILVESNAYGAKVFPEIPLGTGTLQRLAWTDGASTMRGRIFLASGEPAHRYFVHLAGSLAPQSIQKRTLSSATVHGSNAGEPKPGASGKMMKSGSSGSSQSGGRTRSGGSGSGGFGGGGFGGGSGGSGGGLSLTGGSEMVGALMPMPYWGATYQVESDEEGLFELNALSAAEHYRATIYDGEGRKVGVADVPHEILESDRVWEYTLESPLRVSGRVVGINSGEGLGGIQVRGYPTGGSVPLRQQEMTRTAEDGSFTLDLFHEEGAYYIQPVIDGNAPGTPDAPYALALELRRGEPQEITLQLPDPWSRRFRLVDGLGKPVAGARLQLHVQQLDGGGFSKDLNGVESDSQGNVTVSGLSGDGEVQVMFSRRGYLDAMSPWSQASQSKDDALEMVTMFADASATFRVVTKAGEPVGDASLLCVVTYAADQEIVSSVRSDGAGWVMLDEMLPATMVDVEVRMAAPEQPNVAMGGFGEMPPQIRARMAAREARRAQEAGTPAGRLNGVQLADGVVNELGDITLE